MHNLNTAKKDSFIKRVMGNMGVGWGEKIAQNVPFDAGNACNASTRVCLFVN